MTAKLALTFADALGMLRAHRGLSQPELADLAGYENHSSISRMESGNRHPTHESTIRLGEALGLAGPAIDAFVMLAGYLPRRNIYRSNASTIIEEEMRSDDAHDLLRLAILPR